MEIILIFFTIQGLLGAFDTIYHHELKERLPWKKLASQELYIHAIRNSLYFVIFISLAFVEWRGVLAWFFLLILFVELLITFWDFAVEDKTRKLAASERITHTILAVNYGVILAFLVPQAIKWSHLHTAFNFVNHGIWSFVMIVYAMGVLFWSARDFIKSRKSNKNATLPKIVINKENTKFLVTGGSGFIGSRLCQMLINAGHDVTILTRNKEDAARKFKGRLTLIDSISQAKDGYDVIINLAGEPLMGRWNVAKKKRIHDSRINITKEVINYIKNAKHKPSLLLNGSAIGFYGTSETQTFDETSKPANQDFAQELCKKWEETAHLAEEYGVRVVTLRIGIVLGEDGGSLAQMLFPFEFCLGGKMGSGKQWMSWIHIDDLIGIISHIINHDEIKDAVNGTSPNPVNNKDFTKALGKAMNRPTLFAIPAFNLKLMLGEMAEEIILKGQKILPQKALDTGYEFKYKTIGVALSQIIGK